MTIEKEIKDGTLTISVKGRLDTTTAPALEEELNGTLDSCRALVLDFEGLDYISSAGLRVILKTQKAMNQKGGMKIIHVNGEIMEVFEITGFVDILTIE